MSIRGDVEALVSFLQSTLVDQGVAGVIHMVTKQEHCVQETEEDQDSETTLVV